MAQEKNLFGLTNFFSSFFHNISKLLFTNVIFAVPAALFFGIFWFVNTITGLNSNFILFLTAIPLFPFYAGVTLVTAKMARGEENIKVFQTFINGVKENLVRSLIHGVIFYFAIFFSYYSIIMYSSWGKYNFYFYIFLALSIVITIFFLFMFYYVPSMTVTFDISMKNIYKNSALMTFGEFKHNLIATVGLLIMFLVCATVLFCCYTSVAIVIATLILAFLIVPSIMSFVINSAVYKGMYSMITGKEKKSRTIDKKMENRKNGQFFDDEEDDRPSIVEDFTDVQVDESQDGDEYIFYNGKMVKRSVLLKHKQDANNEESNL